MVARRNLQQLQEVDHLVVAPIADVRPGVVRVEHLPVEAVAHDAVRVVAIGGGGAGELEDHALDVTGEGERQRFPVLENVAPVALVVEDPLAVLALHLDGEDVPGAAGIAVAAAEGQRQVLVRQPLQVRVLLLARQRQKAAVQQRFGQRVEKRGLPLGHRAVGLADERLEVGAGNLVAAVGDSAAHDVEQGVREMPVRAEIVAGELEAVGGGHDANQVARAALDVLVKLRAQVLRRLEEADQEPRRWRHPDRPPPPCSTLCGRPREAPAGC